MNYTKAIRVLSLTIISVTCIIIISCLSENKKNANEANPEKNNTVDESFQKTGWLSHGKYRSVAYVITYEECRTKNQQEIESIIKFEAYKHLQKLLNPSMNRNASVLIQKLIDENGKVIKNPDFCDKINLYYFDVEKNDLDRDFTNIKNFR